MIVGIRPQSGKRINDDSHKNSRILIENKEQPFLLGTALQNQETLNPKFK